MKPHLEREKNKAENAEKGNFSDEMERGKNNLKPDPEADGDHSTFKRDGDGEITNTATYKKNPKNPKGFTRKKRVEVEGDFHTNSDGTKVDTPHVHEDGKKDVRPAREDELPKTHKKK